MTLAAPLNVLLVSNYAPDKQHSILSFSAVLEHGLAERGIDVRVARPNVVFSRLVGPRSRLRKWLGYVDKFLVFPRSLRKQAAWADVVHICDHSNAVYVALVDAKPSLVTCHDLLAVRSALGHFPENVTGWSGRLYQRWILRGLKKSPHIACVSEATRIDVLRWVGSEAARVFVVHNGLNYAYSKMSRAEADRTLAAHGVPPDREFLLHVGGNQWYKNRTGVLEIFAELAKLPGAAHLELVLAGHPLTERMKELGRARGLANRITELSDVDPETLRALYSRATGLLFPSLYEGFGWPIVEAHACGCPVFTSARAPMTEVGGDRAVYIDPCDPARSAQRILEAIAKNEGAGEESVANAARFTTKKMVDDYASLYTALAEARADRSPLSLKARAACKP